LFFAKDFKMIFAVHETLERAGIRRNFDSPESESRRPGLDAVTVAFANHTVTGTV
jgi:hypothetical protein